MKSLNFLKSAKLGVSGRSNPNLTNSVIEKDEPAKFATMNFLPQHYFHERRSYLPHVTSLPSSHSASSFAFKSNTDNNITQTTKFENLTKQTIQERCLLNECNEKKLKQQSLKKQKLNDEILFFKKKEEPVWASIVNDNIPIIIKESQKLTSDKIKKLNNTCSNKIKNFDLSASLNHRWREERALKYDEFNDTETDNLSLTNNQEIKNNLNIENKDTAVLKSEQPCSSKSLIKENVKNNTTNILLNFSIANVDTKTTFSPNNDEADAKINTNNEIVKKLSDNILTESPCLIDETILTISKQCNNKGSSCGCVSSTCSLFQDSANKKEIDGIICSTDQNLPSSVLFEGIYKLKSNFNFTMFFRRTNNRTCSSNRCLRNR